MFFNATDHAHIPIQLYDGDGILITNAIEMNTVTGSGLCFLDLDKPESWPRIVILSLEKYVGSSLVECKCQWRLPIKVTSLLGCELKDESQVMVAIRYHQLKRSIERKFDSLAKQQDKAFERLRFISETGGRHARQSDNVLKIHPRFRELAKKRSLS